MGKADLAEKNLLQYKDVFSDVVNVNLFGGKKFVSEEELSREPTEMITKSDNNGTLQQLHMDVPMCYKKKGKSVLFFCIENQSDVNNIMPVRDMGYQHAKYREQIRIAKEKNRQTDTCPNPVTKELHDEQKLRPVITVILNYGQKKWDKPMCLKDMLGIPKEYEEDVERLIPNYPIRVINLAEQSEDTRYKKAKELIEKKEDKGGRINMCVLLDMYEERGVKEGVEEVNHLNRLLLEDNRVEDMKRAVMDIGYQRSLLKEYGIRAGSAD